MVVLEHGDHVTLLDGGGLRLSACCARRPSNGARMASRSRCLSRASCCWLRDRDLVARQLDLGLDLADIAERVRGRCRTACRHCRFRRGASAPAVRCGATSAWRAALSHCVASSSCALGGPALLEQLAGAVVTGLGRLRISASSASTSIVTCSMFLRPTEA